MRLQSPVSKTSASNSMATPPPHWSLTTTKPYQNHQFHHHNHQTLQIHHHTYRQGVHYQQWTSLKKPTARNAAKSPPGPTTTTTNPSFPSLSSLPPSTKSKLSTDFSGRRSTRFVFKMHFSRPKNAIGSRHTSTAEEALHQAIRHRSDDRHIDSLLLNFEHKLSGTDDYTYLLRDLGNHGEYSMAIRCFEFAVQRERRRNEQGKLAITIISVLGRLGKVNLARKVFDIAVSEGYGNTLYTLILLKNYCLCEKWLL